MASMEIINTQESLLEVLLHSDATGKELKKCFLGLPTDALAGSMGLTYNRMIKIIIA